jgi:hypothetical protein
MEDSHLFNAVLMIERRTVVFAAYLAQEARKRGLPPPALPLPDDVSSAYSFLMNEVRDRGLNARLNKERADREDGAVLAAALEQGTREEAPPLSPAPAPPPRRLAPQCRATIRHSTYGLIRCGRTEQHREEHRWKGKRTWRVDVYEQLPDSHRGECAQWFWHASQPQAQQPLPLDTAPKPRQPEPADAPDARFSRLEIDDETGSLAERKKR